MGVSENGGTPKSSIFIGVSLINHPFWGTTILGNPHIRRIPLKKLVYQHDSAAELVRKTRGSYQCQRSNKKERPESDPWWFTTTQNTGRAFINPLPLGINRHILRWLGCPFSPPKHIVFRIPIGRITGDDILPSYVRFFHKPWNKDCY